MYIYIHRYFHLYVYIYTVCIYNIHIYFYLYIEICMVTTLRTEVNTNPQCPTDCSDVGNLKAERWTIKWFFLLKVFTFTVLYQINLQKVNFGRMNVWSATSLYRKGRSEISWKKPLLERVQIEHFSSNCRLAVKCEFSGMLFWIKDTTWKCSFWTFFIKLWVGPQIRGLKFLV